MPNALSRLLFCLLPVLPVGARAQEPGPAPKGAVQAIIGEYEDAVRANTMKIINAATEEEKARHRATIPSAAPYATRVLAWITGHPDEAEAIRGVTWLVSQCSQFPEGQQALGLLRDRFSRAAGIAPALRQFEFQPPDLVRDVLEKVVAENPNRPEQAAARMTLATQAFNQFEGAQDPATAGQWKARAEDGYSAIIADYGDVVIDGFKLADQASIMLFEITNLTPGARAPEIEGRDAEGQSFKLSDYRGKNVLLVFWGEWCHGCHGVLPLVADFAREHAAEDFIVLGINTDIPEAGRAALSARRLPWRNWLDEATSGPITTLYNIHHFPTLFLIDPSGVITLKNPSLSAVGAALRAGAQSGTP